MPVVAPVLNYVLHDEFTPAQRAQLTRSHKKVEQILGVTPSLRPVPPSIPVTSHRRSKSMAVAVTPITRTKAQARERGKLRNLFGIEVVTTTTRVIEDDREAILHRVSTDSSTSSSSSDSSDSSASTSSLPEYGMKASRLRKQRPPPLKIAYSNFGSDDEQVVGDSILVKAISPKQSIEELESSPVTPLFPRETGRQQSRASIIAEQEWNTVIKGVNKLPISQKDKSRKLNRLGKHFGIMPPLEMVFPPTPTHRSRSNPKRYTLELPPPLVQEVTVEATKKVVDVHVPVRPSVEVDELPSGDEKVMRVNWEEIDDEASRKKLMDALRMLRN